MLFPCVCVPQEMYPPKVHQFAYVTDEACTEDEILSMEIIIMKVKNYSVFHGTSVSAGLHLSVYTMPNLPPSQALMKLDVDWPLVTESTKGLQHVS